MPARPCGLLEPCAATSGPHGSEEGGAGKRHPLSDAHHHIRDVTFKEDASRIRAGASAQVMAIIRNLVISLLHRAGYHNIAEGRRAAAWDRNRLSLDILGL